MKQLAIKGSFIWMLVVVLCTSCYEDQDGCLDIDAKNYDVLADSQCDDCCVYPDLIIDLRQTIDGQTFSLGDTITNDLGLQTRILSFVYFLSGIELTVDGEVIGVSDRIQVDTGTDTILVRKDALRVKRSKARYTVGSLRQSGAVTALSLRLGLDPDIDGSLLLTTESNDLTTDPDSLRSEDNRYQIQRLLLGTGPDLTDTMIVDVDATYAIEMPQILLDTTYIQGFDKVLPLEVDYGDWFDEVDFSTTPTDELQTALARNLSRAFSRR